MSRAFGAASFEEERQLLADYLDSAPKISWEAAILLDDKKSFKLHTELQGILDASSAEVRRNLEVALRAVSVDPALLPKFDNTIRDNPEVVAEAVRHFGNALRWASDGLRHDKGIVLLAVRSGGCALHFASDSLRGDADVVGEAIRSNGRALEFADVLMRAEKSLVLDAVKSHGLALAFATKELQGDREVVLAAVANHPGSLRLASPELRADKDFVLLAIRQCKQPGHAALCYREAHPALLDETSWESVETAAASALAVRGQSAPVLSVALYVEEDRDRYFCEVSLLSGNTFTCEVAGASQPTDARFGTTVNDLTKSLASHLPRNCESSSFEHFFVSFVKGDGEFATVTPWDWDKDLSDYAQVLSGTAKLPSPTQTHHGTPDS